MYTTRFLGAALALAVVSSAGFAQSTQTQASRERVPGQKLTYEEAWKACAPYARQESWDNHTQRFLRAAACMKRLGHNI